MAEQAYSAIESFPPLIHGDSYRFVRADAQATALGCHTANDGPCVQLQFWLQSARHRRTLVSVLVSPELAKVLLVSLGAALDVIEGEVTHG